ncbi:MAG: phosphatase PAP2 family protein, partial [Tidjanibacter sp.]|nr:phosphatase PAP2 family protein [Tidjanibacter sp.]
PLWVLLVGYSRIYLGVHFLSQILFGWVLGALVGGFVVWLLGKFGKRFKESRL